MGEISEYSGPSTPAEYFDQCTLSGDELESGNFSLSELIEIQVDGEVFGPLKLDDLKTAAEDYALNNNYQVKTLEEEGYLPLYEHPAFQRRKDVSPVSNEEEAITHQDISERFFYLHQGQKWGPVDKDEIWSLLKAKKLLMTDMVSPNEGDVWYRVCQLEQFDRRGKDLYDPLPGLPEWQIFKESNEEVNRELKQMSSDEVEMEAIAGLAFIGNINSGKAENKDFAKSEEQAEKQIANESISSKFKIPTSIKLPVPPKVLWGVLLMFSIVGIFAIFWPSSDKQFEAKFQKEKTNKAPNKITKAKVFSPKIKVKRVPAFKPNKASRINRRPAFKPRTSKSFLKSKSFRNTKARKPLADNPAKEKDDYYYDDGLDPVELDPIREKVSKETLDPDYEEDPFYEGDERSQKTKKPKRFIAADEEDNLIFVDGEEEE
ncbi:MAG: hypothetical protein HN509_14300 [Halobacteriovoraceae bacterium]|jgi:hypothetical protein|nr:hypothetical protein [Halobacteriovoraceae bacterium]MBT5095838.1 hypothetical protein [Halobacteriovoraceae bacterium]